MIGAGDRHAWTSLKFQALYHLSHLVGNKHWYLKTPTLSSHIDQLPLISFYIYFFLSHHITYHIYYFFSFLFLSLRWCRHPRNIFLRNIRRMAQKVYETKSSIWCFCLGQNLISLLQVHDNEAQSQRVPYHPLCALGLLTCQKWQSWCYYLGWILLPKKKQLRMDSDTIHCRVSLFIS